MKVFFLTDDDFYVGLQKKNFKRVLFLVITSNEILCSDE